jgi:hypothetical protein
MFAKDHYELFRYLMGEYCLRQEDMLFVDDIAAWCREQMIPEPDAERPFRLVLHSPQGCKMLIREGISDELIEQRINALRVRSQLKSVAVDVADRLNSDRKKLAYLFLSEYATSLPEIGGDLLLSDDWAFKEMERLGFFKT